MSKLTPDTLMETSRRVKAGKFSLRMVALATNLFAHARTWEKCEAERDALMKGLAAQMYRERLVDLNSESGDWPPGVEVDWGELDYQAEMIMRAVWSGIPRDKQNRLFNQVAVEISQRLEKKHG
jgi:hypothetical protein